MAHLQKNICVVSQNKITLIVADNRVDNRNTSSFVGSSKMIKLGEGLNKIAISKFSAFLKRNATCGADITIFHESSLGKSLGVVVK